MERTITILGTIDNCKKAESLISAKLRASYESDMSQFMLSVVSIQDTIVYSLILPPSLSLSRQDHSPTHSPPDPHNPLNPESLGKSSVIHPQSLPATPTAVRTFQDFSQEHTRLTTLHGSTGALEVNGLGGFYSHVNKPYQSSMSGGGSSQYPSMEGPIMGNGSNGYVRHNSYSYGDSMRTGPPLSAGYQQEDDLTDVFHGLSLKDPPGIGYGRSNIIPRSRRSSAPTQPGMMVGWPESIVEEDVGIPPIQPSKLIGLQMWANTTATANTTNVPPNQSSSQGTAGSIWSPTFGSRPESELSSYHDSDSSANGFSPIYSPVNAVTTTSFFEPFGSTVNSGINALSSVSTAQASGFGSITSTTDAVVSLRCSGI